MTTRAQQFEIFASGALYNGAPLSAGYAKFYAAGTTTAKNAYEDKDKSSAVTKQALDAQGRAEVYGDGVYKILLYEGDPDAGGTLRATIDNYKCTAVYGNIAKKTSDYTADRDDSLILVDTSSGDITISLDDVNNFDGPITIKKISASNTVTIDPYSTQTIDGDATVTMMDNNDAYTLYPDTETDVWRRGSQLASGIVNQELTESLTIDEDTAGASVTPLTLEGSAVTDTGTVHFTVGKDTGDYNYSYVDHYHKADDDTDNACKVGIKGGAEITMDGSGSTDISGGVVIGGAVDANGNVDISGTLDIGSGTTRRVAPGPTFPTGATIPLLSATALAVNGLMASGAAFESVGPTTGTGSGKTNDWAALDSVAVDADWIEVMIVVSLTASDDSGYGDVYARGYGDSTAAGVTTRVAHLHGYMESGQALAADFVRKIPLVSRSFEVTYEETSATASVDFYLIGYGFNG